jgi:hypothetical protein
MNFSRALSQISEIRDHLAKVEVYRGFRSLPVAISGGMGLVAAWIEAWILPAATPLESVAYWTCVAAASALIGSSEVVIKFIFLDDAFSRRRTRKMAEQFLPSLLAGAIVTLAVVQAPEAAMPATIPLLPGLWSIIFGLGVLSSRPHLPRAIGWVGLYFLVAGAVLLGTAGEGGALPGAKLGLTFGLGQLAAALVLYWNLERRDLG